MIILQFRSRRQYFIWIVGFLTAPFATANRKYKDSNMSKKVHNLILNLFYGLVTLTPLIFFKGVNEIFEFPKMTFVYLAGGLIIFLFLIKRILFGDFKFDKSSVTIFVLVFLATNVISTLFSMTPYTSIWGYYTRFNGGLASVGIFSLLFLVVVNEFSTAEKENILSFIIFSSIPVSIYAIAQNFGYEKGYWEEDSQARVFSTLGQPNWLAAYILLTIFPAIGKLIKSKDNSLRVLLVAAVTLNFSALWFTYSLSGLLGFTTGCVLFIRHTERKVIEKNRRMLVLITSVCLCIAIIRPGLIKPRLKDAITDIKSRISTRFEALAADAAAPQKRGSGDTAGIRVTLWKGTLSQILTSLKIFLIGSGPETFAYVFPKHRPQSINFTSEWDFVFNKPHNYYLELFSNIGLLGLASYLFLIINSLRSLIRNKNITILSSLAGLFVSDFFGWHTVTSALLLFVYIGFAQGINGKE